MVCVVFGCVFVCTVRKDSQSASQIASQPAQSVTAVRFSEFHEKKCCELRESSSNVSIYSIPKRKPSVYIEHERNFVVHISMDFVLLLLVVLLLWPLLLLKMVIPFVWTECYCGHSGCRAVTKRVSVSCVLLWLWYVFKHIHSVNFVCCFWQDGRNSHLNIHSHTTHGITLYIYICICIYTNYTNNKCRHTKRNIVIIIYLLMAIQFRQSEKKLLLSICMLYSLFIFPVIVYECASLLVFSHLFDHTICAVRTDCMFVLRSVHTK